ncbi:2OG-Fe(II) oxygenase [Marinomonas foliarum]|jgi:SM-20-related protein|uniref:2OG-Fe(II) oxygenase n=1 Tax=Marinomonas foliarum TaxID=491950 RepID=A0A369A1A1_9GAMM|nr:2OG-Fe(II) oxygenase [Marinomonas foliarum]QRV23803.1 2OG-Fe(II) oxygenase [Marinomonas foliarum]RCX01254.1 SM-20-related protein [Marinomonas foliarum]
MSNKVLPAKRLYVENSIPAFSREEPFANLLMDLQTKGWSIQDDFFSMDFTQALMDEAESIQNAVMLQAGIGRKQDHQIVLDARRDYIQWIDPDKPIRTDFLKMMADLRVALNRRLFLGLFDYEAHFARYEKGAFYEKHIDAFKGESNRILSTVLYLNEDWQDGDGGELIIYDENDSSVEVGRFFPKKGRLAVFLSECFYHEVVVAKRTRHSIAGWFRVNNTTGSTLDPDQ